MTLRDFVKKMTNREFDSMDEEEQDGWMDVYIYHISCKNKGEELDYNGENNNICRPCSGE